MLSLAAWLEFHLAAAPLTGSCVLFNFKLLHFSQAERSGEVGM